MANKHTYTVDEIVEFLRKEEENETIEGSLLRTKLIRELYKQVGVPSEKDFPNECRIAGSYWKKIAGYTKDIDIFTKEYMEAHNDRPTNWCVERPSMTKIEIVQDYTRAGWTCTVQAYNVMCNRFVQHPRYKDIWVMFYSSRDCNKYEYVILREENE